MSSFYNLEIKKHEIGKNEFFEDTKIKKKGDQVIDELIKNYQRNFVKKFPFEIG